MFFLRQYGRRLIALLGIPVLSLSTVMAEPLRYGVLSIAPPVRIYANWQPFAQYLSQQLDQDVKIVVPRGFKKMKQAAVQGKVDVFYVNSHVFYRLKQMGKAIGVAQMENIKGEVTSRSDIFVRRDSEIRTVKDLKGKSIAFVSPMGAGGYLAPRAYLYSQGVKTKEESKEVFTKNLSNSLYKVLLGEINAGTMCGVNYRLMSQKLDTGELRIIGKSAPYPENVIAARADLNPALVKRIREIIIQMPNTEQGRQVLKKMHAMKIRRFLPYNEKIEEITRKLLLSGGFQE